MSESKALFDARRLDRIKHQVMSVDEAEKVVYDIAVMQTALQAVVGYAADSPAEALVGMAQQVLKGAF